MVLLQLRSGRLPPASAPRRPPLAALGLCVGLLAQWPGSLCVLQHHLLGGWEDLLHVRPLGSVPEHRHLHRCAIFPPTRPCTLQSARRDLPGQAVLGAKQPAPCKRSCTPWTTGASSNAKGSLILPSTTNFLAMLHRAARCSAQGRAPEALVNVKACELLETAKWPGPAVTK